MMLIKNQSDMDVVKRKNIDKAVVDYIDHYFTSFANEVGEQTQTHGVSIQKYGLIIFAKQSDTDITSLGYSPYVFNSVAEEVKLIQLSGDNGNLIELLHGLYLPNNDFGIDLIAVRGRIDPKIEKKLLEQID